MSWAGKGIEPYGVDYILQKLGFAHARVTIPKWMQRGCMDPLDKILAVVMEKMIAAVKNDREESSATAYIWMLKCVILPHVFNLYKVYEYNLAALRKTMLLNVNLCNCIAHFMSIIGHLLTEDKICLRYFIVLSSSVQYFHFCYDLCFKGF